ncbi:MAG: GDP-fucose synthetase, partial [Euryarchaeota archaeon]|nr:GDP-fucose synthetase [Euryarchaeota archaeon]
NIGTGVETKISELVDTICDIMGFDGEIIYNDSKLEGQPRRCLDVSKAKELLGFEAKTSLRDGLQQTINWFQRTVDEHRNKGDNE